MNSSEIFLNGLQGNGSLFPTQAQGNQNSASGADFGSLFRTYMFSQEGLKKASTQSKSGSIFPELIRRKLEIAPDPQRMNFKGKMPKAAVAPQKTGLYGISGPEGRKEVRNDALQSSRDDSIRNSERDSMKSRADDASQVSTRNVDEAGGQFNQEPGVLEKLKDLSQKIEMIVGGNPSIGIQELQASLEQDPELKTLLDDLGDENAVRVLEAFLASAKAGGEENGDGLPQPLPDNSIQEILQVLRDDPADGTLWKSMDDETAEKAIQSIFSGQGKNPTQEPMEVGETSDDQDPGEDGATDQEPVELWANEDSEQNLTLKNQKQEKLDQARGQADDPEAAVVERAIEPSRVGPAETTRLVPLTEEVKAARLPGSDDGKKNILERLEKVVAPDVMPMAKEAGFGSSQSNMGQGFSGNYSNHLKSEMRQGVPTETVRGTVFSHMVEHAQLLRGPQELKTLTIQLNPEFLGKVRLELKSTKDGTVTAKILTDNAQVKEKIQEIAPQIKNHLAEQGIVLNQFTVDVSTGNPDDQNGDSQRDHAFAGFRVQGRRGSAREFPDLEDESAGPILPQSRYALGIDIRI